MKKLKIKNKQRIKKKREMKKNLKIKFEFEFIVHDIFLLINSQILFYIKFYLIFNFYK